MSTVSVRVHPPCALAVRPHARRTTPMRASAAASAHPNRPISVLRARRGAAAGAAGRRRASRTTASAATAPPPEQKPVLEGYAEWCDRAGIKHPSIRVAFFGEHVRGVEAMDELAAGATLVELPRKACMMVGERDSCPFPDFVTPALWDELKGDEYQGIVRLALCLLHEKSKGASSGYAPYIQQLPEAFYTLDSFNNKEAKELQYTPRLTEAKNSLTTKRVDALYAKIKSLSPQTAKAVSKEQLQWAWQVAQTRVFSGPLDVNLVKRLVPRAAAVGMAAAAFGSASNDQARWIAVTAMAWLLASDTLIKRKKTAEGDLDEQTMFILMPMIDAINHDSNLPTTAFEFNSLADKFEMASASRVAKGEQAFISYGPLSNDDLAARYGFVQTDNREDSFVFDDLFGWLRTNYDAAKALSPKQLQALDKDGTLKALEGAQVKWGGAISPKVLQAVERVLDEGGGGADAAGGQRLYGVLAAAATGALEAMGTTVAEDEALLAAGGLEPRRRLAVQFRLEKKRLLQSALDSWTD